MADLCGRKLAIHAPHTAPGCFARIVLRKHGLDPDHDVQCIVRHPGDYQMDLRHLREGSIDAAYVGSTLMPEQVAAEEGYSVLAWVGDHFQIPTVGIAVDPTRIPLDDPALQALVRANKRALSTIIEKPQLAFDYIANFLGRLTREEVQQYYERYIGPYFSADGKVDLKVAQQAVNAVATELGVTPITVDQIYQSTLSALPTGGYLEHLARFVIKCVESEGEGYAKTSSRKKWSRSFSIGPGLYGNVAMVWY